MNKHILSTLGPLMLFCFQAFAQAPSWEIQPSASTIKFTGTQNNAPVSGEFKNFSGDIKFDANNLKDSKIKLTVDMNSVSAGFQELATMLKTMDWFDAAKFPNATFESTEIVPDKKGFLIKGDLKVRDHKAPIQVKVLIDENSPNKMKLHGATMLSRTKFGVGQGDWANTSEIKDEVDVKFNIELKRP